MYAQLGSIKFQNLKGFNDMSKTGAAVYAEHKPLTGKPRLEPTGLTLNEIALSMRFHVSFCKPERELTRLKQYRDENEVLPFLHGNGLLEGVYIITEINETIEDADATGNIFSYMVRCTLREYVTESKLKDEQDANAKKAAAVGDKKPVNSKKSNTPTCPQTITKLINRMENEAKQINETIQNHGGARDSRNKQFMTQCADAIIAQAKELETRINAKSGCVAGNADLKAKNDAVLDACTRIKGSIALGQSFYLTSDNGLLQKRIAALKAAAAPVIKKSIVGKS